MNPKPTTKESAPVKEAVNEVSDQLAKDQKVLPPGNEVKLEEIYGTPTGGSADAGQPKAVEDKESENPKATQLPAPTPPPKGE